MALEGYHWIIAEPGQTDNATYEFLGGEVAVQYEPGGGGGGGATPWNVGTIVVMAGG